MTTTINLSDDRSSYPLKSKELVNNILQGLRAIRSGNAIPVDGLVNDIRRLKLRSRNAGFRCISDLCQQMEDRITKRCAKGDSRIVQEAPLLIAGCNYIRLHTRSLMHGMIPPSMRVRLTERNRLNDVRVDYGAGDVKRLIKADSLARGDGF